MDGHILIKLLQAHHEQQRKIREFAGRINLAYFEIDLLGLVLDAVGVPADNSLAQIRKYGYGGWIEQPDTFSRGRFYDEFQAWVKQGGAEECQAYLENVTMVSTFHYLLSGSKLETAFVTA